MSISITLQDYLDSQGMEYELVRHPRTSCSSETAQAAHISGHQLAKSVVVEDDHERMAVVVPATHYVALSILADKLGRSVYLATEEDLDELFNDCEQGSIPAAAQAFGLKVLVDESLLECEDVYFEAGDHSELVHMSGAEFNALMARAGHGRFGHHA